MEITLGGVLHDDVEISIISEGVVILNDVGMFQLLQHFHFFECHFEAGALIVGPSTLMVLMEIFFIAHTLPSTLDVAL